MTERLCGGCRHWGDEGDVGQFRACAGVVYDLRFLATDSASLPWGEDDLAAAREFREAHRAVVQEEGGHYAAILCREDFGCVLWEAKCD